MGGIIQDCSHGCPPQCSSREASRCTCSLRWHPHLQSPLASNTSAVPLASLSRKPSPPSLLSSPRYSSWVVLGGVDGWWNQSQHSQNTKYTQKYTHPHTTTTTTGHRTTRRNTTDTKCTGTTAHRSSRHTTRKFRAPSRTTLPFGTSTRARWTTTHCARIRARRSMGPIGRSWVGSGVSIRKRTNR